MANIENLENFTNNPENEGNQLKGQVEKGSNLEPEKEIVFELEQTRRADIDALREDIENSTVNKNEGSGYIDWEIKDKYSGGSSGVFIAGSFSGEDNTFSLTVERNGITKEIDVSEEEFDKYKIGDSIKLKPEKCDNQEYVKEVKEKILNAETFDQLEEAIISIGDLETPVTITSVDDLLEMIAGVKKGKKTDYSEYDVTGDFYGFYNKLNKFREDLKNKKREARNKNFFGKLLNKISR